MQIRPTPSNCPPDSGVRSYNMLHGSHASRPITFRRAIPSDFDEVRALACQLAAHIQAPHPPLTRQQFERFYLTPHAPMHLLVAAVDADRILGLISWTLTHELYSAHTRVYISDLVIHESARGQGIGQALMREALVWAREQGADKIAWDVWRFNETAKAFYEKLGGTVDDEALSYVLHLPASERLPS